MRHLKHYSYSYCFDHLQNLWWDRPWEDRPQRQCVIGTSLVSTGNTPKELSLCRLSHPPILHSSAKIPLYLLQLHIALFTVSTQSAANNLLFTKCCIPAAGSEPYNLETIWLSKAVSPSSADQSKIVSLDLCVHFDQVSTNIQNFSGSIKCYSTEITSAGENFK